MRGYFGVGVEGISKSRNAGAIYRTAHAFGASFAFSVQAAISLQELNQVDTSGTTDSLPFYHFDTVEEMLLPRGCALVGIEITDDAVVLPSFQHPKNAAYVLGSERGGLTDEMIARCDHIVKIPTKFSLNVGLAAALVMYDRQTSLGNFARRPVMPGGPTEPQPGKVPGFGPPLWVRKKRKRDAAVAAEDAAND
jgi:tRNA G18 (ribose-2'-O)-methylase SpoU